MNSEVPAPQPNAPIEVVFDQEERRARFAADLAQLPQGEKGFFGLHLVVDKRTGGFKRDDEGNPVRYTKPESPFEH